eukprot:1921372-Alexandrium_andersonii.AAC.1
MSASLVGSEMCIRDRRLPRRGRSQPWPCRVACRPEQGIRAPAPRVGPLRAGALWRAAVVARPCSCLHQRPGC